MNCASKPSTNRHAPQSASGPHRKRSTGAAPKDSATMAVSGMAALDIVGVLPSALLRRAAVARNLPPILGLEAPESYRRRGHQQSDHDEDDLEIADGYRSQAGQRREQ